MNIKTNTIYECTYDYGSKVDKVFIKSHNGANM